VPKSDQNDVKNQVGEFLVEQILKSVSQAKSPVVGESWPKLSKEYRKRKEAEGGSGVADMELTGELLNALDFKTNSDGVEIGFFGEQAWKADGHLKFSGKENNTPQRRFLPEEGQKFKADIQSEIEKIILDATASASDLSASDLKEIETKSELYNYLSDKFGIDSRSEIRMAVLRNPDLVDKLDNYDLLGLL